MDLPSAFYVRDGSRFVATALTRGPWDDRLQHGGPPSALLAGAMAGFGEHAEQRLLVRVTVDLLRPVPIGPVEVSVEPTRVGRRVDWLRATLRAGDRVVAQATGVRIALADVELPPPHCPAFSAPPPPESAQPLVFPFFGRGVGYHHAVDLRIVEGTWGNAGPVTGWLRTRVPLVEGRPLRPVERVMILADAQNGVCTALDVERYAFINPDLTVYFRRPFEGDWIGLRARSTPETLGVGLAQSELHDHRGEVGRVMQSLAVAAR